MLEERISYDKYRRKTGEAKEGHIQAAEKIIHYMLTPNNKVEF